MRELQPDSITQHVQQSEQQQGLSEVHRNQEAEQVLIALQQTYRVQRLEVHLIQGLAQVPPTPDRAEAVLVQEEVLLPGPVETNILIFNKMKKNLIYIFSLMVINFMYTQDLEDAIRYSSGETQGTARFKAMSGAFGALGADISAVSINPAGSAIFSTSHGVLSASTKTNTKNVSYGNGMANSSSNNVDLHQIGAAFVFKNYKKDSFWNKFVFSLFYDRTNDFNTQFSAQGTSNNSISSYFLSNAEGLQLGNISALEGETISQAYAGIGSSYGYDHQQAFLGYNSYILEPVSEDLDNINYTSNIAPGAYNQQYDYLSLGNSGKFSANIAFQYNDNISLGLNLNSHFIDFEKNTFLFEENNNAGSTINEVNFENKLYTKGEGFSLQLGTIIKLSDAFRFGFSYDSPTWLTLREESTQYLSTFSEIDSQGYVVNPTVINIFPEYKLKAPGKITGSLAYVVGKLGLISFDYARKNYANTAYDFRNNQINTLLNNTIDENFTVSNSYRIGGELRQKKFSFRGGYKMIESPYKDKSLYGDLSGFSLGLGYNFGNSRLDVAFVNTDRTTSQELYSSGDLGATTVDTNISDLTISLSINL